MYVSYIWTITVSHNSYPIQYFTFEGHGLFESVFRYFSPLAISANNSCGSISFFLKVASFAVSWQGALTDCFLGGRGDISRCSEYFTIQRAVQGRLLESVCSPKDGCLTDLLWQTGSRVFYAKEVRNFDWEWAHMWSLIFVCALFQNSFFGVSVLSGCFLKVSSSFDK